MSDLDVIRRGLVEDQRRSGIPQGIAERQAEAAVRKASEKKNNEPPRERLERRR